MNVNKWPEVLSRRWVANETTRQLGGEEVKHVLRANDLNELPL